MRRKSQIKETAESCATGNDAAMPVKKNKKHKFVRKNTIIEENVEYGLTKLFLTFSLLYRKL